MSSAAVRLVRKQMRTKASRHSFGSSKSFSIDNCGCAMGARFLGAALLIATGWYGWRVYAAQLSIAAAVVRVLIWSFFAAGAGKLVGITLSKRRARHPLPTK